MCRFGPPLPPRTLPLSATTGARSGAVQGFDDGFSLAGLGQPAPSRWWQREKEPRLGLAPSPHRDYWEVQFPFARTENAVFLEIGLPALAGALVTWLFASVSRSHFFSIRAESRASVCRHHPELHPSAAASEGEQVSPQASAIVGFHSGHRAISTRSHETTPHWGTQRLHPGESGSRHKGFRCSKKARRAP